MPLYSAPETSRGRRRRLSVNARSLLSHAAIAVVAAIVASLITLTVTASGSESPGATTTAPAVASTPAADAPAAPSSTPSPEWLLVWSDEFEGSAGAPADPQNWTYETGGSGWGNDELQYYTDGTENAALDGSGNLVITAQRVGEDRGLQCWYGPCQYTSARLNTAGLRTFQYGRIEARAQLPSGGGLWPAFWALGDSIGSVGWPQSGEIDIMEFVGNRPDGIFGTVHGPGYSGGDSFGGHLNFGRSVGGEWHVFTVEWSPGNIVWEVDGIAYHTAVPSDVEPDDWVFDQPFWLLTNMAVGGNFGGSVDPATPFPQSLTLDYVRVYESSTAD